MIEFIGQTFREGGQWKMRIVLPEWVIDDILRDSGHMERVVISLTDATSQHFGMSTWDNNSKGKTAKVITTAIFTEEGLE